MNVPALSLVWDSEHRAREWGRWPCEALVRFVARHYRDAQATFLEIGCGAGANVRMLATGGHKVAGIDVSEAAINRCLEASVGEGWNKNASFGAFDAGALPFHDELFDCVVDVCCIQHLAPDHAVLAVKELARVLKPGGRLFAKHVSNQSWPGFQNVGQSFPRTASQVMKLYGDGFNVDVFHQVEERRHPEQPPHKAKLAHWIVEGVKR